MEHTPIDLQSELNRLSDSLFAASAEIVQAEIEADRVIDHRDLDDATLQSIADVLAEASVRAEDLADSIVETLAARKKLALAEAFIEDFADWPPRQAPNHSRLGNHARWYWCGNHNCPECRERGVIPVVDDS